MRVSLAVAIASAVVGSLAMTAPAGAGTQPASDRADATRAADSGAADDAAGSGHRPNEQWRSYWVDSFNPGIYTPEQVDKLVADAKAANVNALIVQVGRNMDCFCNDSSFPRTEAAGVAPAPYDPLAEVIAEAHDAGIEVHAWVNATTFWRKSDPPQNPDHVFNTHGLDAAGADRWLNKRHDGTEAVDGIRTFLDPANPAAVDYFTEGVASLVRNYDIDGVNLDYIRYPDYNSENSHSDWGYSETSIARFQEATGRSDVPEPDDPEFSDWRRDQVTNFVRKIYMRMYELDPSARLSINAITYGYGPQGTEGGYEGTRTYANVLQDWKGWLSEGIVDTVVTMNYKREHLEDQQKMFAQWNEFTANNQANRSAVTGPGIYLNSVQNSVEQAESALAPTDAGNQVIGWSGYAYATPSRKAAEDDGATEEERAALAEGLTADLFAEPAEVPEMTWKTEPTTGHLQTSVQLRDGSALDQARVTLTHLKSGERTSGVTDGSGWVGFVDLKPGRYLARVHLPRGVTGKPVDVLRVSAGELEQARLGPFRQH